MSPKVWLITGCSSGFGQALALEALGRDDKVIATARNVDKIKNLKDAGANTLALDVTAPPADLKKKAEESYAVHGRIDYLINNAGEFRCTDLNSFPYHQ
jgi:NAD(P)-dependent dehydrogenase (short-subunit alcohol dehydrogenase family)